MFKHSVKKFLLILALPFFCFANSNAKSPFPKINKIVVKGNKYVKDYAILNRCPFKVGERFDISKTNTAINNI